MILPEDKPGAGCGGADGEVADEPRAIGPRGRALRMAVGVGLLYLAGGVDGLPWSIDLRDAVLGFVVLPALTILAGLLARRYVPRPLRLTGPGSHAVNCIAIVALVTNPYSAGGITLFYGTTLMLAAVRRQPGCEITVLPNLLLGRADQIGCPMFAPIDAIEKHPPAGEARSSPRAERPGGAASPRV